MTENSRDIKPSLPDTFSFNKEEGQSSIIIGDKELFIRKAFETDPPKAIELLFKLYYKPLCSHAVRFVYSKEIAEDVVSDVFYSFLQKSIYTQVKTSYRSYLFASVRHNACAYIRREVGKTSKEKDDSLDLISSFLTPLQILQYDELHQAIEKIINELHPQCRKAFLMSRYESMKYHQIAQELHISKKTVEAHITKALRTLRAALQLELGIALFVITGLMDI